MNLNITPAALALALATSLTVAAVPAAQASGGNDTVRRGSCSGSTHWKLKVGPEDGRLEVEGEVDSNRNGQTWRWSILHNGSLSASGTRTTRAPSGSFEVRRTVVNLRGTDTLTFRARNPRTGEQCRGIVRR
jgi:hypothetical protein